MFLTILFSCSLILWIFDRFSPYSYQNNRDKYADDDEQRLFDLKESLWFCMTSLTPQGGGEAPKSKRKRHVLQRQVNSNMNNLWIYSVGLSGRLVAATWWLFGYSFCRSFFTIALSMHVTNIYSNTDSSLLRHTRPTWLHSSLSHVWIHPWNRWKILANNTRSYTPH